MRRPPDHATPPAATLLVDGAGTIAGWSAEAEHLLGYSPREAVGLSVGLLAWSGLGDADALTSGDEARATVCRRRDGQPVQVCVEATVLLDGEGASTGTVIALRPR